MSASKQLATFFLKGQWYGINVTQVQEVTKELPITRIPLAPAFVSGLINLRGQIATAISMQHLFGMESDATTERMNVICRVDGLLLSLLVDQVGEVVDASESDFESAPGTIDPTIRRFVTGVFKMPGQLLSVLSTENLTKAINETMKE